MIASIIATFTTWRAIFGVQGGMSLIGLVMAFFFVPKKSELSNLQYQEKPRSRSKEDILAAFNPSNVFRLLKFPSILLCVSAHIETCKLLADSVLGRDLRSSRHQPILPPFLRPSHHKPPFQLNFAHVLRSLLPRAGRGLPSRQRRGRPPLRPLRGALQGSPRRCALRRG